VSDKAPIDGVRIDVWLWRARFFKTRALAARGVEDGAVRVSRAGQSRRLDKPSALIRCGDGLTISLGGRLRTLEVAALGERRGPASEARALYSEAGDELDGGHGAGQTD
jgi:ribosome-associated heat shock protein Hsp15